jgi:hypothetical protein
MIHDACISGIFATDDDHMGFKLSWSGNDGFGEVSFDQGARLVIRSEYMGKDFVKEVLCKMVDDAILEE